MTISVSKEAGCPQGSCLQLDKDTSLHEHGSNNLLLKQIDWEVW